MNLTLLRVFSWRHARQHPLRVILSGAAVALGVALFMSVDVANNTVTRSVERTVDELTGRATLQVTRVRGVGADARALERLRALEGVIAAPVVSRTIALPDLNENSVLLYGVDFFSDIQMRDYSTDVAEGDLQGLVGAALFPDTILITARLAARHGIKVGTTVFAETPRGRTPLLVSGLLQDEGPARVFDGNFAIMELHWLQSLFDLEDRCDRIELAADGISEDEMRGRAQAALGDDYTVRAIPRRSSIVENSLAQIRSLVAISAIALVVGLFIIYNSVSISVLERVREIGILRSLGAKRSQILGAVLLEWSLVGFVGSLAGVAFGYLLASLLVRFTARTVNMLVLAVDVRDVIFSWHGALFSLATGTAVAAAAALFPALGAMRVTPLELLRHGLYRAQVSPRHGLACAAGVTLTVLSGVLIATVASRLPAPVVLVLCTVTFFALALCGPQMTIWIARWTRPLLRRWFHIEGYLAADNAQKFPQRTALTVVAFGGAVAMMVASASMILSFKLSSGRWMREVFPFDLSLNPTDLSTSIYSTAACSEAVLDEVRAVPGVSRVYGVKAAFTPLDGSDIMVIAIDLEEFVAMQRERGWPPRFAGLSDARVRAELRAGNTVFISQNLAALQNLAIGDSIDLATPDGPHRARITATVEDYSWPAGSVFVDRGFYREAWHDRTVTYTDIRLQPGVPIARAKQEIAGALKNRYQLFAYDVDDLMRTGSDAMDQSVKLADVQVLIAMVIGFLGIVNTLLISVIRRTREIGLLRAVGSTRTQVRRTVVLESMLIALVGGAFGVAAGLVGAAFPLSLFTLKLSGFQVPFAVPWRTIGLALCSSLVLGLLASLYPARRAANLNVLDAIGYE